MFNIEKVIQKTLLFSCSIALMLHVRFCMIPTGMPEKERQVMKKLKDIVDKQRDEIRAKDHELTLKNEDVEAVRI